MIDFRVKRTDLLTALQNVANAVRDNKAIPALSGVHLHVSEDKVEIKGTDLEMSISASLKADVTSSGRVLVKADTLQEYLREINEESIRIQQVNNEIKIETARSSSSYSTMDHNDYPETFNFSQEASCTVNAEKLVEAVEKTIVGAAPTPDNLAVHSVRLDISDGGMKIVTSDTYRLFFFEEKLSTEASIKASLPLRTANSIVKIIKNLEAKSIEILSSRNLICFKIGNVSLLSKLIDLPYPDYISIISNFKFDKEVLCGNDELAGMLKRVQIFARNNSDVRNGAIFRFGDNTLQVEAISDQARVKEEITIVKRGNNMSISLNVKFVLDFLQQIKANAIMKLNNEDSAVMLSEDGKSNFICLTMPLSLG